MVNVGKYNIPYMDPMGILCPHGSKEFCTCIIPKKPFFVWSIGLLEKNTFPWILWKMIRFLHQNKKQFHLTLGFQAPNVMEVTFGPQSHLLPKDQTFTSSAMTGKLRLHLTSISSSHLWVFPKIGLPPNHPF